MVLSNRQNLRTLRTRLREAVSSAEAKANDVVPTKEDVEPKDEEARDKELRKTLTPARARLGGRGRKKGESLIDGRCLLTP